LPPQRVTQSEMFVLYYNSSVTVHDSKPVKGSSLPAFAVTDSHPSRHAVFLIPFLEPRPQARPEIFSREAGSQKKKEIDSK
jgi:hypothetical protein